MGFVPLSSSGRTANINANTAVAPSRPRRRRRVSFAPTVQIKTVPRLSCNLEEKRRLYHSKAEIHELHAGVEKFYASHPDRPRRGASPESSSPSSSSRRRRNEALVRLDADSNLRGLEFFFYPARTQNKSLERKSLLQHYDDLNADETLTEERRALSLAAASLKLSYWSKLVAAETGKLDEVRAYGSPDLRPMCREEWPADDDDDIMSLKRWTVSLGQRRQAFGQMNEILNYLMCAAIDCT